MAVQAGRRTIAVFRVGDEFFAVNNAAPTRALRSATAKS